jgi:hypothetical protein
MKALTISQPFASLIASGEKWIENRMWPTNYRGELAIHAGKGTQYLDKEELAEYPTSCVIAVARLAACVTLEVIRAIERSDERNLVIPGTSKTWAEACEHPHAEGPWCWILEDIRIIEPVPMRGAQRLWDVVLPQVSGAGEKL